MRISLFTNRQDNSARTFILLPKKVNSKRIFVLFNKYMLPLVQSWTILLKVMNEMGTKNSSIFSTLQKVHAEKSVVRLFVLLMSVSSIKEKQKNFTMTVLA